MCLPFRPRNERRLTNLRFVSTKQLICPCGQTVFEPPISCGTEMRCTYQCSRPPPPCGHPRTQHTCHRDDQACPPCPFLAVKRCACGKKEMGNVRCSLERDKVSCGTVCGRLMSCGFHHCERLCHGDDCGPCTAPCGKSRKLWYVAVLGILCRPYSNPVTSLPAHHPCALPCHAPSTCAEQERCQSLITLTCPCGRIRQPIRCSRSSSQPSGPGHADLKCSSGCAIAERNARLADALGINVDSRREGGKGAVWNDDVVAFGRADPRFVGVVEKAFAEYVIQFSVLLAWASN